MMNLRNILGLMGILAVAACLPYKHEVANETKGYNSGQLEAYEAQSGNTIFPDYPKLFTLVGAEKEFRMAIFIAYDKVEAKDIAKGVASPELISLMDPRKPGEKDFAASAFNSLIEWFKNSPDSVLKNAKQKPIVDLPGAGRFGVLIEGKGPSIAKQAPSMNWKVSIHLGIAGDPTFAKDFGEALASSHIAMLNGHFYPNDAKAAYSQQDTDKFSSPDYYQQDYFANVRSNIYVPARDAFVAKAKLIKQQLAEAKSSSADSSQLDIPGYQIAVFNGCGSEEIEDLFLKGAASVGQQKLDIVGMRGFSNYRNFGQQIARFLRSMHAGDKWSKVIQSFKYEKDEDAPDLRGTEFYGTHTGVCPVFRNSEIGADGDRQDLAGCLTEDKAAEPQGSQLPAVTPSVQ